ncbi:RNA-directed DNA polymerase [Candidatus Saccharibacteria bacterium]|nr:RNA-directed DNA polymerase [Candidatus Saccharibacteria bacterium]
MAHRKTRRIYDAALEYERLYAAWNTVLHTCKNKRGLYKFALFGQAKVAKLLEDLKARKYWPSRYRCFMVFEPKPRLVMSQSIKDKVVNHFVTREYLIPILERTLIDTNVATRVGKGSAYAHKMVWRYMTQMMAERPGAKIYALKIDISKYFYTIDHEILMDKLRKKIKDPDVLELIRRIVSETDKPYINRIISKFNKYYCTKIPFYLKGKGLSIGAMTSQFLAIFYLSDLDWKIKEEYGCRWYLRYMDDFLILGWDKAELQKLAKVIEEELRQVELEVNPKSAIYNCCFLAGFSFLGYRYYIDNGRLRVVCLAKTVRRVRRRLRLLEECNYEKYQRSYESYRGYFWQAWPKREIEEMV